MKAAVRTTLSLVLACAGTAAADEAPPERFALHGQFTYTEQETLGFDAPYAGPNSLSSNKGANTTDATLYAGVALWSGAEWWTNLELDQGRGLDDTLGLAGFPSGEAYKVGRNHPYLRLTRSFVRDTIGGGGERSALDAAANQLGGTQDADRWVVTAGKFGVTDVFDNNRYAHDPRNDFLNWTVVDAGTFDYAADAWGYTAGVAVERYRGAWTVRAGLFDLSDVPNNEHLDPGFHEFQGIMELEHRHALGGHPGKLMITAYDSRGRMGLLNDAVALAQSTGMAVDIAAVRAYRSRLGASVDLEQELSPDLGLFARAGKAAGNVEAYEFTDVDRSVSAGAQLKGSAWRRGDDSVGIAGVVNGISADRERYLNAGGLGILVGDGRLAHPGAEQILETYYAAEILPHTVLTLDYQWFDHPAYNRDRGPVSVVALRLHAQF
jgi:high affinity Mn2+ porin